MSIQEYESFHRWSLEDPESDEERTEPSITRNHGGVHWGHTCQTEVYFVETLLKTRSAKMLWRAIQSPSTTC